MGIGSNKTNQASNSAMNYESAGMRRLDNARILMYSHDTFGLGHLRRCRAIAHALVERFKGVTVLIISGSQIAGAFDFRARGRFRQDSKRNQTLQRRLHLYRRSYRFAGHAGNAAVGDRKYRRGL